ncbi:MAG: tRNA guanosine(34) transglycosylase Tgt [bacterium]|nr:tRNA guanosine(34) transglycosylase Tgt [bacterium]
MKPLKFEVIKEIPGALGRAGVITTFHGIIKTPAFVTVGTKATVKALTPEQVKSLGAQVVLANTYHLYLEPGEKILQEAGGLHQFMNWDGPTMTDSGGFQVFSLGAAFGQGGVSKIASNQENSRVFTPEGPYADKNFFDSSLAKIDEDGVTFKSYLDGSEHRFTPEHSMEIQHAIGADIMFAFDECTSPQASYEYQQEAMTRTHRWAERSLKKHLELLKANEANKLKPALFGIVQGGRHQDLREESAKFIASLDFDGFGIGGSFNKDDLSTAVAWVNNILPTNKPRHLLGIGEVEDLFAGVENGVDTFDCVMPTRMARNGTLQIATGRLNILNAQYKNDFTPVEEGCVCYTCQNYTRAYLAHLFRSKEILANTLASIHNLYFFIHLVDQMREHILAGTFKDFKNSFLSGIKKVGDN